MGHGSFSCVEKTGVQVAQVCSGSNRRDVGFRIDRELLEMLQVDDYCTIRASETYAQRLDQVNGGRLGMKIRYKPWFP